MESRFQGFRKLWEEGYGRGKLLGSWWPGSQAGERPGLGQAAGTVPKSSCPQATQAQAGECSADVLGTP